MSRFVAGVFLLAVFISVVSCGASSPDEGTNEGSGRGNGPEADSGSDVAVGSESPEAESGSQDDQVLTNEESPGETGSIVDFLEIGILAPEEIDLAKDLIEQATNNMLFAYSELVLGWNISLGQVGEKVFRTQESEIRIADHTNVGSFGRHYYEGTILEGLSIAIVEFQELATFNVAPYHYFTDEESNIFFWIPSLINQEFAFDSGQMAIEAVPAELLRGGWLRASLKSGFPGEEKSFSFINTDGDELPQFILSELASDASLQASYEGEVPIQDEDTGDFVRHQLFSFDYDYSRLLQADTSFNLFGIFFDDLGISETQLNSLAAGVPVKLNVYLHPDGFISSMDARLDLSDELATYFEQLGTPAVNETSPGESVQYVMEVRLNFSRVGDDTLQDELLEGEFPTEENVVDWTEILS